MADRKRGQQSEQQSGAAMESSRPSGEGRLARRGDMPSSMLSPMSFLQMSPFSLMRRISEDMDRLFDNLIPGLVSGGGERGGAAGAGTQGMLGTGMLGTGMLGTGTIGGPPIEVVQRDGKLVIRADLPGMDADEMTVTITDEAVIIEGERREEREETEGGVIRSERRYGRFSRVIPLPDGVNTESATAVLRNGVLEVEIDMPEQARGRRLDIQSAPAEGEQVRAGRQREAA